MKGLDIRAVVRELMSRRRLPVRQRMSLILNDVLDGTFTQNVYRHTPAIRALIKSGNSDLAQSYAEFCDTNLNPLSAVYRPGLHPVFTEDHAHRVSDLPALPGPAHWQKMFDDAAVDPAVATPENLRPAVACSTARDPTVPAGGDDRKIGTLSDMAAFLHLRASFIYKTIRALEARAHLTVPEVASQLACSPRTLERHLHAEGTTVETLRSVVRLLQANAELRTGERLSEIALAQGFSDQSHMNRCFLQACGLTPRTLQRLYTSQPATTRPQAGSPRRRTPGARRNATLITCKKRAVGRASRRASGHHQAPLVLG